MWTLSVLTRVVLPLLLAVSGARASSAAAPPHQTTVAFQIVAGGALANPWALPASTHATLSAVEPAGVGLAPAWLTPAHQLVFRNVSAGSYLVDFHCPTHRFAPLRLDVPPASAAAPLRAWETFRGNPWENRGEAVEPLDLGAGVAFPVRAVVAKQHFVDRPSFSVLSLLRNPMILLGLLSTGLFMGMPYLMKLDPEMRAALEQHGKGNSPVGDVRSGGAQPAGTSSGGGFDVAAFLAGSGSKPDPSVRPPPGPTSVRKKDKGAKKA